MPPPAPTSLWPPASSTPPTPTTRAPVDPIHGPCLVFVPVLPRTRCLQKVQALIPAATAIPRSTVRGHHGGHERTDLPHHHRALPNPLRGAAAVDHPGAAKGGHCHGRLQPFQ